MYSCLLIDHKQVTFLTMSKIVRAIFFSHTLEIHAESGDRIKIIVQGASKELIWQTALDFEVASLHVGYGFGKTADVAERAARSVLFKRTIYKEGE